MHVMCALRCVCLVCVSCSVVCHACHVPCVSRHVEWCVMMCGVSSAAESLCWVCAVRCVWVRLETTELRLCVGVGLVS